MDCLRGVSGELRTATGAPVYNKVDDLLTYGTVEPGFAGGKAYSQTYSTDGTRRLIGSQTTATVSRTYQWGYDVFGNRKTELFTSTGGEGCQGTAPTDYGADNRLVLRHSFAGCPKASRYWTDQAGNRLAETDTATGVPAKSQMTYTAAGQLYYTLTPTAQAGTYDYNWHWYDADGRRVMTQAALGTTVVAPRPGPAAGGIVSYYVYDGSDVALVLGRFANNPNSWWVRQRQLTGGVDAVLAGRYSPAGTQFQNLSLVSSREGTTVASVKADGIEEVSALYPSRNAFGGLEGASGTGSATNTETGFTGASTPNQTGGFTYLRNRWYDPQTGRFLTQDPIGLAGGVNLYAYAGNNPVAFSDPYGLKIVVRDEDSRRVLAFLRQNSASFRRLYNQLEKDKDFTLVVQHIEGNGNVADHNRKTKTTTVTWDVSEVNEMNTQSAENTKAPGRPFVEDVGSAVAHEVGHAGADAGYLPAGCGTDPSSGSGGCIIDYENTVRKELPGGESSAPRSGY